jgi:hypothetical protein
MYRRPGSLGVLQGVLSGPYTGGVKRIDAGKLPRATRQRLADVLAGRAEPYPIAYERPAGITSRFRPAWGLVAAMITLLAFISFGFGDASSSNAIQPRQALVGYGAASLLLLISLLATFRRRARASGAALVPGKYLFPLDVIEVPPADREGRQVVTVSPLGDARDAKVRDGRRRELVVLFEGGMEHAFPLGSDPDGEVVMRRLSRSQEVLEELTYGTDLAKTVALDPLFDLRVDASWDTVAAHGAGTPGNAAHNFLASRSATVAAVVLSGVVAVGFLAARNRLSDRALFIHAIRDGSPEAFDVYLQRGEAYRTDAIAIRDRLLRAREDTARRAEAKRNDPLGPQQPESSLTGEERRVRASTYDACRNALRASASPKHPDVLQMMEQRLELAQKSGDTLVPVTFERRGANTPPEESAVFDASLDSRASTLVWALERVFSETCPAAFLRFGAPRPGQGANDHTHLVVRYEVTWPKPHAPQIAFHVVFSGFSRDHVEADTAVDLTMPPPAVMPKELRDRSIFLVPKSEPGLARDAQLLTARAFDRLYDEIYALFFEGNPRVPLRETEAMNR